MYRSLYQILRPRIEAKATGTLRLLHASRQSGTIHLAKGKMVAIKQGDLEGIEAAKVLFRWINVAVIYMEGEAVADSGEERLNTMAALDQLKKIDAWVSTFKEQIGGCDAVFQFIGQQIDGTHQFTPRELNLSFLLDGKATVGDAQVQCGMSELDLLLTICKFIKHSLVREIRPHRPMEDRKRAHLQDQLQHTLSDITGPVASVIVNDAFQAIGAPPEELAQCDIPHLFSVVSLHLEEDEREAFNQWAATYK